MSQPSPAFTIRPLAGGGTTQAQLRRAVLAAAQNPTLVLTELQAVGVHFPPVCPNCGQPATTPLRIERAFLIHVPSDDDTPNDTLQSIDRFDIPFCDACVHQHLAQRVSPSPWTPLKRVLSGANGFAGLFVMGIALLFLRAALERLSWVPLALAALPLAIGFWLIRTTWNKSRHLSVAQPTDVDLAVDFTPPLALEFEPSWRAFLFRSPLYAQMFSRQNLNTLWNPNSMEAQTAAVQRRQRSSKSNWIVGIVLAIGLLWAIWDDFLAPFVLPYFQR